MNFFNVGVVVHSFVSLHGLGVSFFVDDYQHAACVTGLVAVCGRSFTQVLVFLQFCALFVYFTWRVML